MLMLTMVFLLSNLKPFHADKDKIFKLLKCLKELISTTNQITNITYVTWPSQSD